MTKSKKLHSEADIQLQLDEMTKKAGKLAKDNINKMLVHEQKTKHKTTTYEVVHISKKQWCAALQKTAALVASTAINSKNMNENDKTSSLLLATGCKELAKMIWEYNNCNENEPIEMIFTNPDLKE